MGLRKHLFRLRTTLSEYKRKLFEDMGSTTYILKEDRNPQGIDNRLVIYTDPNSHIAEQYKIMRTHIKSLSSKIPLRSIVITSALRGEGKTVTCCNIALAFSQELDKKVLLVDTDLRKPSVHKMFNIPKEPGLTEVLLDEIDINVLIDKPKLANLYIIPSGKTPSNPSEILSSKKLKDLILQLKERFDYLFFDSPPIIPVTDAGVLGAQLDGAILVVRAASTGALDVERAYSLLKEAGSNPIGTVLCNVITYVPYYLYRYRYVYVNKY